MTSTPSVSSKPLPVALQMALQKNVNAYLDHSQNVTATPEISTHSPLNPSQPLEESAKKKLSESFVSAYVRSWNIPTASSPLSSQEIEFLRSHTIEQLVSKTTNSEQNPFVDFCIKILKTVLTQAITATFTEENIKGGQSHTPELAGKVERSPASLEKPVDSADLNAPINYSSEHSSKMEGDPSVTVMQKIASNHSKSLAKKVVTHELKEQLKQINEDTVLNHAYKALGEGKSWIEAAKVGAEAAAANQAFLKHASQVVATGAGTGIFMTKVEEMGWQRAIADTTKNAVIDFFSKQSATTIATFVGCAHPVWCANILTTIIKDTFVPTETAPPEQDMMKPLPLPSLESLTKSHLPTLAPAHPAFVPPKP